MTNGVIQENREIFLDFLVLYIYSTNISIVTKLTML